MSSQHKAVRTLLRDTALSLADNIVFTYARASDANQIQGKKYPFIRLDPLKQSIEPTESGYNFTKTYLVGLVFYDKDLLQGTEEQTVEILDAADELSDKFMNKLNLFVADGEDSTESIAHEQIELKSIRKNPFIKVLECLTGYTLEFEMVVPDTFEYCALYE